MTYITPERIERITAFADDLSEPYRVAAFQELLRYELNGGTPPRRHIESDSGTSSHESGARPSGSAEHTPWLGKVLQSMPDMHVFASGNRASQAAWALVELYRRGDAATVAAAQELIADELGVSPEGRESLSRRLRGFTPKHATREKADKGYRYKPTIAIVEKFPEGRQETE